MKLSLKLKLQTTPEQKQELLDTMVAVNTACNYVSEIAYSEQVYWQVPLHKLCYKDIRERFKLSAQLAVRTIGKVVDSYKINKNQFHTFKPHGAIDYDNRIWSFKSDNTISIKTTTSRIVIPFVWKNHRQLDLHNAACNAKLIYHGSVFYFCIVIDVEEEPEIKPKSYIGVDMGIINIATDSTGERFAGNHVNNLRSRHAKLRSKLQAKGTKSAKRLLKKRKRKESRFAKDVNHVISKKIVEKAKRTGQGIAVEELTGIRDRIRVRKSQRRQHHSWGFFDLRSKLEYKAKLAGIPVVAVDPAYTSQMCSHCGYVSKANRPNQSTFSCKSCGFSCHADYNAALNIRGRAVVNQPYAVFVEAKAYNQLLLFV